MISIGDYVGFEGRGYEALRGIVLGGPRIRPGNLYHTQYRVLWDGATTPTHWNPRPNGSWESGKSLNVLSSVETKCQ